MSVISAGAIFARDDAQGMWKLFTPLPDQVGFSGMVAGVLGGRLVAAGGSQFPRFPNWLHGEKDFGDCIYTLGAPEEPWQTSSAKLPLKIANPALAANTEAVYFAGGLNAEGCSKQSWCIRADGDGFAFTRLPDLPEAVGYAAGAIVNGRFYVACGLTSPSSKTPSAKVWSLAIAADQQATGWQTEPDLPGPGVFVAAGAAWDGRFYVFGGFGYDAAGQGTPSAEAYALDVNSRKWERLPNLPAARVGISSPCPIQGGKILAIGGYSQVFPGAPREHPGFDRETFAFENEALTWKRGPLLPSSPVRDRDSPGDTGPAPMIGAPCVEWRGYAVIIGGEVRASVRTPAVIGWPLRTPFTHQP